MTESNTAIAPPGVLIYALSDIHGRSDLLRELLGIIEADARGVACERRLLVFLGDYVDRGPDSAGVVQTLISGLPAGFEKVCLMGNHEDLLLEFLAHGRNADLWIGNGANATLASYGIDMHSPLWTRLDPEACSADLLAAMPETHIRFYKELDLSRELGGYFFVHAGVRPGVPLDRQSRQDMLWIREGFILSDADFGKLVVHGHTPGDEPVVRRNRICIDTGAWFSGRLTALRLWQDDKRFLATD